MKTLKKFVEAMELQEKFEEIVNANEGEITNEAEQILNQLEQMFTGTADELFLMGNYYETEIEKIENIINQYQNYKKKIENRYQHYKNIIADIIHRTGKEKLEGNICSVKIRVKEILDIKKANLPKEYLMEKVEMVPDKKRIEDEVRNGKHIEGVKYARFNTVTFYKRGVKNNEN